MYKNKHLNLSETHLDDDSLKYLLNIISKKKNISFESLDLSRNSINDEGCQYIAEFLKLNIKI